jgi:thioredoxin reductase
MNHSDKRSHSADFEVLIIGGGAAGLAAALTLGRLRRKVLICDDQQPRNQSAVHMFNFPGYDGVAPEQWRSQVKLELQKYPSLARQSTRVIKLAQTDAGFEAQLESGDSVTVQKVLLAYGIKDHLPEIPEIKTLWGKTVVHCPFCHGFEFQDQGLALLGQGEMVLHMLSLLLGLSSDLVLLTQGPCQLSPEQRQKIAEKNIRLIETPIQKLEHSGPKLEAVVLANGERIPRDVMYVLPTFPFGLSAHLGEDLGCKVTDFGWYEVDAFGKTSVEGVYAAGDIAGTHGMSVLNSAAFGSTAAARIAGELLMQNSGF